MFETKKYPTQEMGQQILCQRFNRQSGGKPLSKILRD
jgi:hypothetical protein